MRTRHIGLVSVVVLASTMAVHGCKSSPGVGSTGNSQPPDGSACPNVAPCGGDVVGTWTVTSSCLNVTGEMNMELVGTGCPTAPVTGSLHVTGTWTANSDGTYLDNTTTSGDERIPLASSCLVISSAPVTCDGAANLLKSALGFSDLKCPPAAGSGCTCSATVNQDGGIGLVSMAPSKNDRYKTSGNLITMSGDMGDALYSYCVSGNTMTMTPQSTNPTMTGTIVLQKNSGSGSGGTTGSSGGQISAGGTSASGGTTGAGGAGGATGQAGSGGTGAPGGTTGGGAAGGATQAGSGGKSVSGGATGGGSAGGATGQAGSGGRSAGGGATGGGGTSAVGGTTGGGGNSGPCDIYAAANTPCVAAHSMVRALYGAYKDKLYQVRRTDNTTKDILPFAAGGIADTAPQDTFCAGSTCVITVVYDQSGKGNDMWYQGSTQVPASTSSSAAKATDSVTVGGHKVYSLYINAGNCYWHDGSKSGLPTGAQPEGMYMVTSSRHANAGCCFDYGNSETTRTADGSGTMDSINLSTTTAWGSGAGSGPWVMADLEWGLFAQGDSKKNANDPTQTAPFVTAILKNDGTKEFALRGSDAASGSLATYYKGALPGGWSPMKKQGAITLGCGGDCCKPSGGANASTGIFFEGAIVAGYPTDAAENAVQANIVAAGYGK